MMKLKPKDMRPTLPTMRDGGNLAIVGSLMTIVTWFLNDYLALAIPQEVTSAISLIVGYTVARLFLY